MLINKFINTVYLPVIITLYFIILSYPSFSKEPPCNENKKICAILDLVVGIKTPMMIASGTIIDKNFIVTNRHVVEDYSQVIIKFNDGRIKKAYPIPHNYPVDLVLLSFNKEMNIPQNLPLPLYPEGNIRVVAFDQGRNANRVYKSGKIIYFPDIKDSIKGRIHTKAQSLPGNSGGAVVDDNGDLIGFLASGDGNFNEVIPIAMLNNVVKNISLDHAKEFLMIGKYIRLCADNLELAFNVQRKLDPNLRDNISSNCWNSKNKQLIDQAGQTFGRLGELQKSAKFLEKSTQLDPMSPNSLLSLAITYHIDRKIKKEKPIILRLLKLIPEDPQVLRLGIQVAGLLKDKKMSQNILYLMSLHNKEALPLAKKFIDNAFKIN